MPPSSTSSRDGESRRKVKKRDMTQEFADDDGTEESLTSREGSKKSGSGAANTGTLDSLHKELLKEVEFYKTQAKNQVYCFSFV